MVHTNSMMCTEISINYDFFAFDIDPAYDFDNVTMSAKIAVLQKVENVTNTYYFRINNITGMDFTQNVSLSGFCCGNICIYNLSTLNNDYAFDKKHHYVNFKADFNGEDHGIRYNVFNGYIGSGSISNTDGTLFFQDKPCNVGNYESFFGITTLAVCCTKFVDAPIASANSSRCKRFRSRTVVYNDDFRVNMTSSMNYTLIDNQIITHGDFILESASDVLYSFDASHWYPYPLDGINCDSLGNLELKCNIRLPIGDSRTFIGVGFQTSNGGYIAFAPLLGSFLLQNNQTLINEGIPFTTKNDCVYYSYDATGENQPIANEFCCKEFE